MKIEIWSLGKKNEQFINEGMEYFFKKIKYHYDIQLKVIDNKKVAHITNKDIVKKEEESLIFSKLNADHVLILLDEKGTLYDSTSFAKAFQKIVDRSPKTIVFLIGGAFGVSENVYKKANIVWSFSKLVFPHQLMRLMLSEQIYRTISILNNSSYHHE